ncbi:MAG TPA: DUF6249 domain-containing protein, partial [Gemmatimonadales bacterium]
PMFDNDVIVPIVMFIALAMLILGVARVISDTIIRRRLIAAGNSGDIARMLAASAEDRVGGALKWGIVAVAAGAALVIIQLLPYERDEPIVLGIILLFIGIGLLVYYSMARRAGGGVGARIGGSGGMGAIGSGGSFSDAESRERVSATSKL